MIKVSCVSNYKSLTSENKRIFISHLVIRVMRIPNSSLSKIRLSFFRIHNLGLSEVSKYSLKPFKVRSTQTDN